MYAHLCGYGWLGVCVSSVCVCFLLGRSGLIERFTLFLVATVKGRLLTAHFPTCFIRNFMHAFGQLGDNASLFPAVSKKLLARLQIGRLGHSLQLSWTTILSSLKAFWKLSFLYSVIVTCQRDCKNFWKRYSSVVIYSQPAPVVVHRSTYEVWGRPCLLLYRLLITEGRIEAGRVCVCRGLSAERKRVNHVCNRTGFPLKWETEVGSVQIYGAP